MPAKPTTRNTAEDKTAHLQRYTDAGFTAIAYALGVKGHYDSDPSCFHITQIIPGSAAAHAGLEDDDKILEVDGVPVGEIGVRRYHVWKRYDFSANGLVELTVLFKKNNASRYYYPQIQLDQVDQIVYTYDT